jgi:hypothetical protein
MLEVFQEYFNTKLDFLQRRALASETKYALIYKDYNSNRADEPILNIPTEPTFLPEKYNEEVERLKNLIGSYGDQNSVLFMYNINYMVVNNLAPISKEQYEFYLDRYFYDHRQNIALHQYVFTQTQMTSIYKTLKALGIHNSIQKVLIELLSLKSVDDKLDTSDFPVDRVCALFIDEDDMKKRITENTHLLKEFEGVYTSLPVWSSERKKYMDRIDKLKFNLYDSTKTEPSLRDSIILSKYEYNNCLPAFIENELALDMNFGKLIGPIVEYLARHSTRHCLVRQLNSDILECYKRDSRWSRCDYRILPEDCEYARNNYDGSKEIQLNKLEANTNDASVVDEYIKEHECEYRYNDTIRAMVFTAKCCALKEITKSSFKRYGNLASIIKLYNFNWESIWNAVWEGKNEW